MNGDGSIDVDGDPLTFSWSFVSKPASSAASLSNLFAINPTFMVDEPGSYVLQLIVNDGSVPSLPDTVKVSTSASRPVADAGIDLSVVAGDVVNLSGIDSFDGDADVLSYKWSLLHVPGGSLADLDFPGAFNPSFNADLSGSYIAQLIVGDGSLNSKPDTVVVSTENVRPIANAGFDQIVNLGDFVQLIGTDSHDANLDPLNYRWSFSQIPTGSGVILDDANLSNPTFTPDLAGFYLLQLIVDDVLLDSPPDTIGIRVNAVLPVITDFSPKSAPSGELITVTGANLKGPSGLSKVTLRKQGGGNISAPIGSATPSNLTFTIPPGTATGTISVDVAGQSASSASILTIVPANDFSLNVAPLAAELIQGESVAYTITLNSLNGFTQLSKLSLTGLPTGMTAAFKPAQITTGQTSTLTLSAPVAQPLGAATLTVTASATVDGLALSQSGTLSVKVVAMTTSFRGQAVSSDARETPLAGITVTLLGKDGDGNATGCTGSTVSDAAGNFQFTNLPATCVGKQLIRYAGGTAYSSVDLLYTIKDSQVTRTPISVHLPRIDNAETILIQQNAPLDQTFTFQTIPNLVVTIYAGTTFTHPNGTQPNPFPLIATQIAVDRLPSRPPVPPSTLRPFFVSFQPSNSKATQPVAVTYPNQLNTPPGTVLRLTTLDPTKGMLVDYGSGTVSPDGTKIIPDFNPKTPGKRFGISNFDWHFPEIPPEPGEQPSPECNDTPVPGGCNSCPCQKAPAKGKPIDLASGIEVIRETDIALSGSRGSIFIRRVYRSLSTEVGPFGLGSSHNYGFWLDSRNPNTAGNVNLVMPDGNRFALSRQDDIPDLGNTQAGGIRNTLRANRTVPKMQGAVLQTSSGGTSDLHWKEGTIFHFASSRFSVGSVLTGITNANGNTTTFAYSSSLNKVISAIDPLGHETRFVYDGAGNLLSVTDAKGNASSIAYDIFGLPTSTSDALGEKSFVEYDDYANPVRARDALSQTTTSQFDAVSRPAVLINALGQRSERAFDKLNRVTSATDAQGRTTQSSYDKVGNLLSLTDARGHTTTFTYDDMNRLLTKTDPLGKIDSRTYDLNGNLIKFVDRRGQISTFTYDALNRLIREDYQDGSIVTREYDASSRLIRVNDSEGGVFSFDYDLVGRLIRETGPFVSVSYVYDKRGSMIERQVLGQPAVKYVYDAIGNLLSTATPQVGVNFTYDARNQMIRQSRSNGVGTDFVYDALGRLSSLTHAKGVTELNQQSYLYDAIGRRIATTTSLAQPLMTPTVIAGVDPLSNRMLKHGGVTYTHDLNGNRLSETGPAGITSYLWDGRNRLKSVTAPSGEVMRFRYDFAGNMIEQTKGVTSKQFVLDSLSNVVFQSSSDGDQFSVLTGQSIDSHLGVVRNGAEVDYALTDGLNSTAAITDETGVVNGTASYEPFGATTQTGEVMPFQFTGRVQVSEGLYYYRARFYDSNVGRFVSEDPIGFSGGDVNLYRYVGNDPVNAVDPEGVCAGFCVGAILAGAVYVINFDYEGLGAAITEINSINNDYSQSGDITNTERYKTAKRVSPIVGAGFEALTPLFVGAFIGAYESFETVGDLVYDKTSSLLQGLFTSCPSEAPRKKIRPSASPVCRNLPDDGYRRTRKAVPAPVERGRVREGAFLEVTNFIRLR